MPAHARMRGVLQAAGGRRRESWEVSMVVAGSQRMGPMGMPPGMPGTIAEPEPPPPLKSEMDAPELLRLLCAQNRPAWPSEGDHVQGCMHCRMLVGLQMGHFGPPSAVSASDTAATPEYSSWACNEQKHKEAFFGRVSEG